MSWILPYLALLAALPAVCLAGTPGPPIPPGPIAAAHALVETGKASEAMAALASLHPAFDALGPYHYVYGRACDASGNPVEAAMHFRRASIYAEGSALKETALFLAAETEFRMGYRYESKTDSLIFLKKFPESPLAARVRVLLGRSLAGIGRFHDAVREFDAVGGRSAEALYGKANALQRMGRTGEAAKAYAVAMTVDGKFPASSEETRCWLGENLRLSGATAQAREILSSVSSQGVKDYAAFGLAEIEAAESATDNALRLFGSVVPSRDRKLGRIAMLRIADVEAAAGKTKEAVRNLEEIVANYPFTPEYDQAMLRLSRARAAAGDPAAAVAMFSKLVVRPSTVRGQALDEIEGILLDARSKGAPRMAALWNAGGRWMLDPSREAPLVLIAEELRGTGAPHLEAVRWLARYGSASVRPKYLVALAREYAVTGDVAGLRDCLAGLQNGKAAGDDVTRIEAYLKYAVKDLRGAASALLSLREPEEGDVSMLGEVLVHAEDPRKAISVLEAHVSRSGASPRVLRLLGDALYDAGRKADAVGYYRMAVEKEPENEWSCYRLAVLLGKDGGEEYRKRIRKDPALVRMATAAWKEQGLDAR